MQRIQDVDIELGPIDTVPRPVATASGRAKYIASCLCSGRCAIVYFSLLTFIAFLLYVLCWDDHARDVAFYQAATSEHPNSIVARSALIIPDMHSIADYIEKNNWEGLRPQADVDANSLVDRYAPASPIKVPHRIMSDYIEENSPVEKSRDDVSDYIKPESWAPYRTDPLKSRDDCTPLSPLCSAPAKRSPGDIPIVLSKRGGWGHWAHRMAQEFNPKYQWYKVTKWWNAWFGHRHHGSPKTLIVPKNHTLDEGDENELLPKRDEGSAAVVPKHKKFNYGKTFLNIFRGFFDPYYQWKQMVKMVHMVKGMFKKPKVEYPGGLAPRDTSTIGGKDQGFWDKVWAAVINPVYGFEEMLTWVHKVFTKRDEESEMVMPIRPLDGADENGNIQITEKKKGPVLRRRLRGHGL